MRLLSRRYDLPRSARQILGISGALAILLGATGWGVNAANLSGPSNWPPRRVFAMLENEPKRPSVRRRRGEPRAGRRGSAQNKAGTPITASRRRSCARWVTGLACQAVGAEVVAQTDGVDTEFWRTSSKHQRTM